MITSIYTEQFGLQSYIINGARSPKSKKTMLLQPATILDLVVYKRENKNLQHIKEMKLALLYQSLPLNIVKSSTALFIIETLMKSIKEEEANSGLFKFIYEILRYIDECQVIPPLLPVYFLIKLSEHLGFYPEDRFTDNTPYFDMRDGKFKGKESGFYSLSGALSNLFSEVKGMDIKEIEIQHYAYARRKELLDALITFYSLHVSNFKKLKSVDVLEEIFRN